jgi:hypothetical protein
LGIGTSFAGQGTIDVAAASSVPSSTAVGAEGSAPSATVVGAASAPSATGSGEALGSAFVFVRSSSSNGVPMGPR